MNEEHKTHWGTKAALVLVAAACAGGALFGARQQDPAAADAIAAAHEDAAVNITGDLAHALKLWTPGTSTTKLTAAVDSTIFNDPRVTAVYVWSADGKPLLSTPAGSTTTANANAVSDVASGTLATVTDDDADTLRTYAKAGPYVGRVDLDGTPIVSAARQPWVVMEFALAGFALIFLASAVIAGNASRPQKVAKPEVEDDGSAAEIPASEDPALKKMRARADKAEASRRAMEDQLSTLRAQIQSGDAGSEGHVKELEQKLHDAHRRVTGAEEENGRLSQLVAELEAAAAADTSGDRLAQLDTELAAATARIGDLTQQVTDLEARAARAETADGAHGAQLEEAHQKAREAEDVTRTAVDAAAAAADQATALQAQLDAVTAQLGAASERLEASERVAASDGLGHDEQLAALQEELRAQASRVADAETLAASADLRRRQAEDRLAEIAANPDAEPLTDPEPDPSVAPEVEAGPEPPDEMDETDAIRKELERVGRTLEHAGEAGDVDGLRERLTKTAARKKGRAVDERVGRGL